MTLEVAQKEQIAPWDDIIWTNEYVTIFRDRFPVTTGHMLVVPQDTTHEMIQKALSQAHIEGERMVLLGLCEGYNIGLNMGAVAGQTVMYPHVHVIPRRSGDTPDPVGGVRGVIPGQANYRKPDYRNPNVV